MITTSSHSEAAENMRRVSLIALVSVGLAALAAWLGLGGLIEIGSDERFEVTKGLLWGRGVPFYSVIWNDQPLLHTVCLGLCFECFGSTAGVARGLSVIFGSSLLIACSMSIERRHGLLAAVFGTVCLLTAPPVFQLCVSVMLEVPAIGTALWAFWPILRWQEAISVRSACAGPGGSWLVRDPPGEEGWVARALPRTWEWPWLLLSGGLLATALQIKLTAAIAVPALALEILLGNRRLGGMLRRADQGAEEALGETPDQTLPLEAVTSTVDPHGTTPALTAMWRRTIRAFAGTLSRVAIWGASVVLIYVVIGGAIGMVPLGVLWASHFSPGTLAGAGQQSPIPFWFDVWWNHADGFLGSMAGLGVMMWRRDWRRLAFPLVWLATAMLIHAYHRPWWWYYYLHLAVPMAWLSGYGIAELFQATWTATGRQSRRAQRLAFSGLTAASLLGAVVSMYGGDRLWREMDRIRHSPRVEDSALIAKMREYADRTRWVYTRYTIYPFHAGLLVIPELAVLPRKRFWSGQITDEQIWVTVKKYRPEQLLLTPGEVKPEVREFLAAGYVRVYQDEGKELYVAKGLLKELPESPVPGLSP